ncbi:MAG TPA: hypothetical protein VGI33_05300 [Paenibacillus sp.]
MRVFSGIMKWFFATSTWVKALWWLAASQIVYFTMLWVTIPAIQNKADGMKIFDLMFVGYSPQYVASFLDTIGEEGRKLYLMHQIPLDLIYPGLMAVTGALFIALFSNTINRRLGVIMFVPIFGAVFDYLENIMVAVMLYSFPNIPEPIVTIASISTIFKTILDTLYLVSLMVLFVIFIYKVMRGKGKIERGSTKVN